MSEAPFIPARLKEAMHGISNTELADKLHCSKSSVSMYLTGRRVPSRSTLQLMAITLHVNPLWLMGLSENKIIVRPDTRTGEGPDPLDAKLSELLRTADRSTKELMLTVLEKLQNKQ